jgi:hypothetical protein
MNYVNIKCEKTKKEILCLSIIVLWFFISMYYYDNQTAFLCIQDNMDRIVAGEWYYLFNGWFAIPYGNLFQGVCGIWSLPVFILSRIGNVSRTSVGARLWYKVFIMIFLSLDICEVGKLSDKIGVDPNHRNWVRLFFSSSLLVLLPAVHIAQFDAVYLFFILLGIENYLDNKYWRFLFCFMLAIPGKYIPLFIFIPLVLLKEKRYLYIIRDLAVGCTLVVVDKLMNSIGYRIEGSMGIDPYLIINNNTTMTDNFNALLTSDFNVFNANMSLVVLCFGLLCIWCYMKNCELKNELAIFVSFMGIAILFALGESTPYWIILIVPFIILLIFKNDGSYKLLLTLETIFSVGYVYVYMLACPWIFGSYDTFDFLIFSLIPGFTESTHGMITDFIKFKGLDIYDGAVAALMLACLIGVMAVTYPLKQHHFDKAGEKEKLIHGWYWARIAIAISWILLNVWVVALNHVW